MTSAEESDEDEVEDENLNVKKAHESKKK